MSISCVSASDNSNTTSDLGSDISVDDISVPGSFDELNNNIKNLNSGDVYNLTQDYVFSDNQYLQIRKQIINIGVDNVTINGNGHVIDGNFRTALFEVTGCNVKIFNLTFINSKDFGYHIPMHYDLSDYHYGNTGVSETICKYNDEVSPICWSGDNGLMKDCVFSNNTAINGGAITWSGNNGSIEECQFINNTASGAGGAIYIGGINNTISNCTFINSNSLLTGEAIFVDRCRKNINLLNNSFTNNIPVIDGAVFNIDVNYLLYSYNVKAYGEIFSTGDAYKFDIIPLIYKSIVNGGKIDIDERFSYYAQYFNKSDTFIWNIAAHDVATDSCNTMDFDYVKSFYVYNATDFNQVFDSMIHGNYAFDISQIITHYVSNANDYNQVVRASSCGLWFNTDKDCTYLSNGLKVVFTQPLTINSAETWNPKEMGFNTIVIMGNGATINGGADDCDEEKWLVLDNDATFIANNLTIKSFNTAIECMQGTCYFNNMDFENNRMDYWIDRDWGAAILSTSVVFCNNCTFKDNYAKYGGAIFNQGYLSLNNCTFKDNTAYSEHVGDNVCIGDGGRIVIDGENITSTNAIAYFAESASALNTKLATATSIIGSFLIGFIAGVITANPAIGIAAGLAIGAGIGTFTAATIISSHFDVNFNRLETCLVVILGSAAAGAAGGFVGYLASGAAGAAGAEGAGQGAGEVAVEGAEGGGQMANEASMTEVSMYDNRLTQGFFV